jgi:histidyl-tRNA synthetase
VKSKYQKIKGTFDILPPETQLWQEIETIIHQTCQQFGFEEIRTPAVEFVNLFQENMEAKKNLKI